MAAILAILGIVVTPVAEAGKALVATIKRQASYLICYRSNVDDLSKEVENLVSTRNDVEGQMNADSRNGQVITEVVQKWLKNVEDVKEDAKSLDDQVKESISCFNLRSRYCLSKVAKKKMDDVCRLQTQVKSINVSYTPRPPTIESLPARGFMPLKSIEFSMNQVMDALKDDNINMIGVYGMGGVGKTTLMKQLARNVKSKELFQEVIMMTLTQKPELKTIQGEIAEQLGLELKEESQVVRAGKLSERLQKSKKILLIFDNLWERLDLDEIGIPLEWNDRGCKIAFTTRSEEVCGDMKSQAKIRVNVLSKEDAWDLFQEKVGDAVKSPELHAVARKVVKECGGLPLAIVTVGMALYDKDKRVWDDALIQLQSSNPTNIKGMDKKVFSSLEMSFNYLESKEAQLCFLFCCLFQEGYSVSENEMTIYGTGEGLFKDVNTLEEASCRVHTLFVKLKASCLLLEGDRSNSVKMHDVVRDVALSITSRAEHGFLVRTKVGLKEWPEIGNVQECKRISLAYNEINKLPDQIECPQLLTLFLFMNYCLKEIPNDFFQGMNSLKVLDLSDMDISMLPPSLECLKNLRTLWLDRCPQLKDVSLIGGLKKLEILRLQETGICELTEKMGELRNLKLLDLMETSSLEMIAPNVISRMTRLEELRMGNSFGKWEIMRNGDARQASLAEMASLSRLTVLYIHVENVECLFQDIPGPWGNLKKFGICVGRYYKDGKAARSIKIENSPCPNAKWVEVLFNRTYELELVRCEGLDNLMQSDELGFSSLEVLLIKECGEMEHFVSVKEEKPLRNLFMHLKELALDRLTNLKMFCQGPLPAGSFQNLRKLNISNCNKLINIMPSDLPQNLEELIISQCHELVEVFHFQGTSKEDALLSKLRNLKELTVDQLTNLKMFCQGPLPAGSFQNLTKLNISDCNKLINIMPSDLPQNLEELIISQCHELVEVFHFQGTSKEDALLSKLRNLKELTLDRLTNLKMFCQGPLPYGSFQNLRKLNISDCNKLINIMPSDLPQNLEELIISQCHELVEVFHSQGTSKEDVVLSKLRKLELYILPELTAIWKGAVPPLGSLSHLEDLNVTYCKRLRYLVSPALAQRLQQLKLLHIEGCEKMEKLIGVEVEENTTASLSSSSGSRQSELTCLTHTLPHGRMFPNLQNCTFMIVMASRISFR